MHSSKQTVIKRVLSVLLIVVLLVGANLVLGRALTPVSYAFYFNHDVENIEKGSDDIDLLLVGASRVYRTFSALAMQEDLDLDCVLNAGGSSQPISATYYQLKDLVEHHNVRRVMIGVTGSMLGMSGRDPNAVQGSLIVYDRLSLKNKILLAWNTLLKKDLPYALYTYRFRDNLTKMPKLYEDRKELVESNYTMKQASTEYYEGNGFVYSTRQYRRGNIPMRTNRQFSVEGIDPVKLKYLDSCVELCKKNNIQVDLVTGPTSVMRMYINPTYQDAVDYYTSYAEKQGIHYYNLNYLVGREDFLPDSRMQDHNHVNGKGAYLVCELFSEVIRKADAGEDVSDYFYKDLDDFRKDVHRIVSVKGKIKVDAEKHTAAVTITSLQNEDVTPVYQVQLREEGEEEFKVIADWTEDSELEVPVPAEGKYRIRVIAWTGQEGDGTAFQDYNFR